MLENVWGGVHQLLIWPRQSTQFAVVRPPWVAVSAAPVADRRRRTRKSRAATAVRPGPSRPGSAAHSSGRNKRQATGTGTSPCAKVSDARKWQFARLPCCPRYRRATPTDSVPFLGKAVSSITSCALEPPTSHVCVDVAGSGDATLSFSGEVRDSFTPTKTFEGRHVLLSRFQCLIQRNGSKLDRRVRL